MPLAGELGVDLVVVGPEAPLVAGLADELRHARRRRLRARARAAARIEGSKAFAKEVMDAAGVPTARTLAVARPPCVVKADGLAAGKGVWVCRTQDGARRRAPRGGGARPAVPRRGAARGARGLDLRALRRRATSLPLPAAQDYKRIGDGDEGPNTGGMGSFSPVARLSDAEVDGARRDVAPPVARGARAARRAVHRACSSPG